MIRGRKLLRCSGQTRRGRCKRERWVPLQEKVWCCADHEWQAVGPDRHDQFSADNQLLSDDDVDWLDQNLGVDEEGRGVYREAPLPSYETGGERHKREFYERTGRIYPSSENKEHRIYEPKVKDGEHR